MGVHRRVRHGLRHCHGTSSTTSLREIDRAIRTLSPPVRVSIEVAQFFLGALPPTRIAGMLTSLSTRKPPESLYSQHPCGAGKLIPNPTLQTCARTYTNIMSDDDLKTATHVVACPSSVCADQCSAEGASGSFNCFNNTKLMDMTKLAANERALGLAMQAGRALQRDDGSWDHGGLSGADVEVAVYTNGVPTYQLRLGAGGRLWTLGDGLPAEELEWIAEEINAQIEWVGSTGEEFGEGEGSAPRRGGDD